MSDTSDATQITSDDPHVRAYLANLALRYRPVSNAFDRAARVTPGASPVEPGGGAGVDRVRVPLTTEEAFDALGAGLAFHARHARDVRSNGHLIDDGVFPPPGWDSLRWRALAAAVGADEADADTPAGRERIAVAAMAAVNRRRLAGKGAALEPEPAMPSVAVASATLAHRDRCALAMAILAQEPTIRLTELADRIGLKRRPSLHQCAEFRPLREMLDRLKTDGFRVADKTGRGPARGHRIAGGGVEAIDRAG